MNNNAHNAQFNYYILLLIKNGVYLLYYNLLYYKYLWKRNHIKLIIIHTMHSLIIVLLLIKNIYMYLFYWNLLNITKIL